MHIAFGDWRDDLVGKYLLCKHEDPSLDLQLSCRSWELGTSVSARKADTRRHLGLLAW